MKEFRNIDTGKLYKKEGYRLEVCPECNKKMHHNSYKSLEAVSDDCDDVSISINMQYCKTHGLYIRTDY